MRIPLAAGASDGISISAPSGTTVASAKSSDPSVLSLGTLKAGNSPGSYDVPVTAGNPGSTRFTIYDPSGNEIDHTTVQVAPTTSIPLDVASGATLLTGSNYSVHATTISANGETLAGTGAIHFTYRGSISSSSWASDVCSGDCGYFQAVEAGDAEIDATATSAVAKATLHVVNPDWLDSFSLAATTVQMKANDGKLVNYTMRFGSAVVFGTPSCTSSDNQVADAGAIVGTPGSSASGGVMIFSNNPGATTITCNVGQKQASLVVTVQ
jgi:hypothetical protein